MIRIFTLIIACIIGGSITAQTYVSSFPYTENFDAIAFDNTTFGPGSEPFPASTNGLFVNNWQNSQSDAANQDWYGRSSATGSSNTGPTSDHTSGSGRYIFVEDGWGNNSDVTLETPFFDLTGITSTLAFTYWAHSQTTSTSNLNTMVLEVWSATSNVWVQVDSFANLSTTNTWFERSVDISAYAGDTIQVRFVGNNSGQSFQHDIAIDDFSLFQSVFTATATTVADNFCGGDNQGSIAVTSIFGVSPLTYLWSGGVIANDTATGLAAGAYTVTVTDSNGVVSIDSATVSDQNSTIVPVLAGTDVSCVGSTDGSATVSGTTGGVPAGPCNVTSDTCVSPSLATIGTDTLVLGNTSYPAPFGNWYWGARHQFIWRASELTAAGISAGKINSLAWDVDNITGGATTSYDNVQIQMSCTADTVLSSTWVTGMSTVLSPSSHTIATGWNTFNFDQSYVWDGTSNIVVEFCFNNSGFTRNSPTHYTATSYTSAHYYRADISTVCGSNSNTGTSSNRPNVQFGWCTGLPNPYSYVWSNGMTTNTISGLSAGTYTVTVTDVVGCSASSSITVNNPAPIVANLSSTDITCNGDGDGSATVMPTGGTPAPSGVVLITEAGPGSPDFLEIQNVSNTPVDVTGWTIAASNSYTDINNTNTNSVTMSGIWTPGQIDYWEDATGSNYWGNNLFWNGGSPGWVILIDGSGNIMDFMIWGWDSTAIAGMAITVNGFALSPASAWAGPGINSTCSNSFQRSGSADNDDASDWACTPITKGTTNVGMNLSFSGPLVYSYLWSNSGTSSSISNLSGGTYTVTITDGNGCTTTDTTTIVDPTAVAVTLTSADVTCNGDDDGSILAMASGGTASSSGLVLITEVDLSSPDYFEIQNVTNTPIDVTGWTLAVSNSYTDINNVNTNTVTLNGVWNPGQIDFWEDATGANYWGNNLFWNPGSPGWVLLIDASGNIMDFVIFDWNATAIAGMAITVNGFALSPGTAWNGGGVLATCTTGNNIQRQGSSDNDDLSDWTCQAPSKGITNTGMSLAFAGASTYNYVWSTTDTTASLDSLGGGTYVVTVTDQNGCSVIDSVTIVEPDTLGLTVTTTPVTCPGGTDGTATATLTGGTMPYTFNWSTSTLDTNVTTSTDTGFSVGNFIITVTDGHGCTKVAAVPVMGPAAFVTSSTTTDPSCYGLTDGSGSVSVSGGTPGYAYLWPGSLSGPMQSGLGAGTYAVTITDSNNCDVVESVVIGQPDSLNITVSSTDVVCEGGSDGSAAAAVTGGTMPYVYGWMPGGASTDSINGLTAGNYTIMVTDTNGCSKSETVSIGFTNSLPTIDLGPDQTACDGETVTATATAGLTYLWCDGSTGQNLTITSDINCIVTVTDANGCSNTDDISVTFNPLPSVGLPATDTICEGNEYIITPTQGLSSYMWAPTNLTTSTISVSTGGTYTVTVTDNNGCSNVGSIDLTVDPCVGLPELGSEATVTYFPNPSDGLINLRVEGLEGKDLELTVLNAQGQLVLTRSFQNLPAEFLGNIDLTNQAQGIYFIQMSSGDHQSVHRISVK